MSALVEVSGSFVREQLRAPLTLVLLVAIPAFFVLNFASVLGEFAKALGGTLAGQSATAISAGWAAAFLSGTLGFFQVSSSRGADRRLATAGYGAVHIALARIAATLVLGVTVSTAAFGTLWLRSGIGHPLHAAVAILSFAAIYIGVQIVSTMRDLHGAVMAGAVIAFVTGLLGVFVMQSALQGDRRLVVAGFHAGEAIFARLAVLTAATLLVVTVSAIVTAFSFTPASWPPLLAALALTGLIYSALGALAGAILDKLAATYLTLFLAITDLGIVQNSMFGSGAPGHWAGLLPGYGPGRMMIDGAFSSSFHTGTALLSALAWLGVLALVVNLALRRAIGTHLRRDTRASEIGER